MNAVRYDVSLKTDWDRFIDNAKNASFLFERDYMDYHKDRFKDASLMIYEGSSLVMVLPANQRTSNVVGSHDGLTYGGFVFEPEIKLPVALRAMSTALAHYEAEGVDTVELKVIPRFYNTKPSDEVDYAMFLCDADLYRRDTAFVVDQKSRIEYSGNYRREANKARKRDDSVQEESQIEKFWQNVLVPNLGARFGVKPVHSLAEIVQLQSCFPDAIKCYTVSDAEGELLCGTIFYLHGDVAHAQYISSTDEGRKTGALNLLFIELMDSLLVDYRFFDFGIANENQGRVLNHGLMAWKERMGGRTVVHDFYRVKANRWKSIQDVAEDNVKGIL